MIHLDEDTPEGEVDRRAAARLARVADFLASTAEERILKELFDTLTPAEQKRLRGAFVNTLIQRMGESGQTAVDRYMDAKLQAIFNEVTDLKETEGTLFGALRPRLRARMDAWLTDANLDAMVTRLAPSFLEGAVREFLRTMKAKL